MSIDNIHLPLAIIGLGYVGLPLAVEFGKSRPVIGFDINAARITDLQKGHDQTLEVEAEELAEAEHLTFSSDPADLTMCPSGLKTESCPKATACHQWPRSGW